MCLAQEPQNSDAGEAQTSGLLVSSQALYHWATALSNDKGIVWGLILVQTVYKHCQQTTKDVTGR